MMNTHQSDTLIRFWKPYGVLTKFTDAENRPTLADYIPVKDVYAVGRLDLDSEGLLLLTDNGALNARLINPKYAHTRTYWAQVERVPDEKALAQLRAGVELSDKGKKWLTRPAKAELLTLEPELPPRNPPIRYRANIPTAWISLTLTEGKNRQVRRMTAAVGFPTLRLVRVAIGGVTLEGLQEGEWAHLTPHQRNQLWRK